MTSGYFFSANKCLRWRERGCQKKVNDIGVMTVLLHIWQEETLIASGPVVSVFSAKPWRVFIDLALFLKKGCETYSIETCRIMKQVIMYTYTERSWLNASARNRDLKASFEIVIPAAKMEKLCPEQVYFYIIIVKWSSKRRYQKIFGDFCTTKSSGPKITKTPWTTEIIASFMCLPVANSLIETVSQMSEIHYSHSSLHTPSLPYSSVCRSRPLADMHSLAHAKNLPCSKNCRAKSAILRIEHHCTDTICTRRIFWCFLIEAKLLHPCR